MIALLIKASFVLTILLVFYKLFLEKESFFAKNRIYLLGCLVLTFALPFITLPELINDQGIVSITIEKHILEEPVSVPSEIVSKDKKENNIPSTYKQLAQRTKEKVIEKIPTEEITDDSNLQNTPEIAKTENTPVQEKNGTMYWLLMVYLFGVIVFSLNFISQIIGMVVKIIRSEDKIEDTDCTIINSPKMTEPCSFFQFIFINPETYDYETYEQILAHEKIHVQKRHTLDLLLSEIAVIILWFFPLVWLIRKEVEKNIEYQTDDILLNGFSDQASAEKEAYQMNLLKVATFSQPLMITTNYNQSLIKQRILKMNTKKSNVYSFWKYAFIAPMLFVTLLLLNKPNILIAQNESSISAIDDMEILEPSVDETSSIDQLTTFEKIQPISNKTSNVISNRIEETKNESVINSDCDELGKAAMAGNVEKVKSLLKTLDPDCLEKQDAESLANLRLVRSLMGNDANISIDASQSDLSLDEILEKVRNDDFDDLLSTNSNNKNTTILRPDCEVLEKAAKEEDEKEVRTLLLNFDTNCLTDQSDEKLSEFYLIKDLLERGGEIFIEDGSGNITVRGLTYTVWSEARHKAYQRANNQSNISNPIDHDGLDKAVRESNELEAIRILKNLDPKYLVFQTEKHFEHLKYIKYILNNEGRLTTDHATVYIDHENNNTEVLYEREKSRKIISGNEISNITNTDCKKLIKAIIKNDRSEFKRLLKTVDVNCVDHNPDFETTYEDGQTWQRLQARTPLIAAARKGYFEIGKSLVEAGAKVEVDHGKNYGETALIAASHSGHLEFVKYLLEKGANINKLSNGFGSPLNAAAQEGHSEVVKYLIEKGANVNDETNGSGSALTSAAGNGELEVVKRLLENGANINAATNGSGSALVRAAGNGEIEVVKYLLEKSADIDAATNGSGSALVRAAGNGEIGMVKLLLEKGATIDAATNGSGSALVRAAGNGELEMVKFLLSKGANVNGATNGSGSALSSAVSNNEFEVVKYLLENGADPNYRMSGFESPMEKARLNNDRKMLELLKKYD